MNPRLREIKRASERFWLFSPERLWLLSIRLASRDRWALAFWVKQLNGFLYHNSLAPGANVSSDVYLGHNGLGVVVSSNVTIGKGVAIWQNVTLTAGRRPRGAPAEGSSAQIVVEDNVRIGANVVVIAPRGRDLRIGRGARIGAGTVVTEDVPAKATVVGQPPRVLQDRPERQQPERQQLEGRQPERQQPEKESLSGLDAPAEPARGLGGMS